MGTVVGAVASGRIAVSAQHTSLGVWTGPTSLLTGALFVTVCGYLAAVFLTGEAQLRTDHALQRYFRRRAELAGAISGLLSLVTLLELRHSNAFLYHRLTGRALPLVVLAAVSGVAVIGLLVLGRSRGLRVLSALGVAAVVWGWGVAQYPTLLPGSGLTLANGSAPHATLVTIVVIFAAAALLVGPAFLLLYAIHGRALLESEETATSS
jgi:cytochrome bd ubiquinol oxidase subunit II